jgi:hypothetical protein
VRETPVSTVPTRVGGVFDGGGRKIAAFLKKQTIFVQGDSSDAGCYIQKGKVNLTVVSKIGKEATIGILNEGDFFGEACPTGQAVRLCSANRNDRLLRDENRQEVNGGSASPGTRVFRCVRGIFAGAEHPILLAIHPWFHNAGEFTGQFWSI